jgi:5-methylcytosine-specific restriction endonuclease McrA
VISQHGRGEPDKPFSLSASPVPKKTGSGVTVVGKTGKPLMPCTVSRAKQLLGSGRARIHKLFPFTIRLTDRTNGATQPVVFKADPGAKTSGLSLNRQDIENPNIQTVLHLAEVTHRGRAVRIAMAGRSGYRRRRRNANLRHRAPRFDNRTRKEGWLPPSLQTRVDNIVSWVRRYSKLIPITSIDIESIKFDTQALQNPEISGVEYQQGTLLGYELREYLLEKWDRKCAYCDAADVPLQVEHINPRRPRNRYLQAGSNRVSNLTLACDACNKAKANGPVEKFLADQPERLERILSHRQKPLHSAAAVNATRNAQCRELAAVSGLPVDGYTGGRTKWNRVCLRIPKTHALDAACVGLVAEVKNWHLPVLQIKARGRGSYQRTRVNSNGFPRGYLIRTKSVNGFRTGDLIKARVPSGKKEGTYLGRVAVRANGSFDIQTPSGTVQAISHRHCRRILAGDGYTYAWTNPAETLINTNSSPEGVGFLCGIL